MKLGQFENLSTKELASIFFITELALNDEMFFKSPNSLPFESAMFLACGNDKISSSKDKDFD